MQINAVINSIEAVNALETNLLSRLYRDLSKNKGGVGQLNKLEKYVSIKEAVSNTAATEYLFAAYGFAESSEQIKQRVKENLGQDSSFFDFVDAIKKEDVDTESFKPFDLILMDNDLKKLREPDIGLFDGARLLCKIYYLEQHYQKLNIKFEPSIKVGVSSEPENLIDGMEIYAAEISQLEMTKTDMILRKNVKKANLLTEGGLTQLLITRISDADMSKPSSSFGPSK